MRKLLLNPAPLFRKLRQLSLLLTLLLALPQTAWGQTTYDKGTYNNNTWGNWQVAATGTTISSSGEFLSFNVVNNTTATITLTLTNPGTTSEKICYAHFAYNQNENIPADNKVKLLSAKIVHTNSSETDLTNDFIKYTKSCSFFAKTPVEWSSGDNFVVTLQVNNTTGASTSHTIQAAQLKTGTPYGLIVNGITVTNVNQNCVNNLTTNFNGQNEVAEVVFTPEGGSNPATLTLTKADFDVSSANIAAIESSFGSLKVILAGANTINCGSNNAFNLAANSGLNFTADGTSPGQLTITSTSAITTESFYSPSTATVTYTGLVASNPTSTSVLISPPTSYNITVAGVDVTNANASAITGTGITGTVSYDAATNTLTLNGATINGKIDYNGTTDFTIAINGSNSIENTNGNYAIVTNTTTANSLKFEKATNASTAELTLKWDSGDKAISANDSILGNGLYWKPIAATQMNITDNPEFVIVGDYAIPDGTTVNGTSGTITYNATDKLLTISSFSETYDKDAIRTGVSGLKVKLVGESVVTCNGYDKKVFIAFATSASIQFVKNDASSKLTMSTILDPLFGFAAEAITYDGLFYYNAGNNQYIIRPKFSPTIKFVERDQSNGNIPNDPNDYVYVSGTGAIQMPYVASYYAPKPVFSDHYQLEDSTRYEYTMSVDGVVEFELGGYPYSNPGKIYYADNGKLNILKSGELTITCTFPGNLQNEPCSASYTLSITRVFNNPFANTEQIYATYYNENEDLALPEGIVAYIVTGISGNTVTTAATGYLPQNTAVLLEKTGNVGTTVTGYTGSAGNFNGSLLKYTNANAGVNTTGKEYILYKNEFVKATGTISGACYLDLNGVAPTRGMYGIGNDGSTAIEGIDVEATEDETWYDLQGRRIQKPTKAGIYIVNGKKVIINNK